MCRAILSHLARLEPRRTAENARRIARRFNAGSEHIEVSGATGLACRRTALRKHPIAGRMGNLLVINQ